MVLIGLEGKKKKEEEKEGLKEGWRKREEGKKRKEKPICCLTDLMKSKVEQQTRTSLPCA
jgi:hypothetical protein